MATATAEKVAAATKTEPPIHRARQLAFAIVGLAHAPLTGVSGPALYALAGTWGPALATANYFVHLCFAAFVAWLAFAVFPSGADVSVGPRRWRNLGPWFAAWCVGQELFTIIHVWLRPTEHYEGAARLLTTFTDLGELQIGWLALALLAAAAAEEIVYRALLLRALESYMRPELANVIQAAAFELVHAHVYGDGTITGQWFIAGMVLGFAFQRTRSLAVPTLLHAGHNLLFYALIWHFSR